MIRAVRWHDTRVADLYAVWGGVDVVHSERQPPKQIGGAGWTTAHIAERIDQMLA